MVRPPEVKACTIHGPGADLSVRADPDVAGAFYEAPSGDCLALVVQKGQPPYAMFHAADALYPPLAVFLADGVPTARFVAPGEGPEAGRVRETPLADLLRLASAPAAAEAPPPAPEAGGEPAP